MRITTAFFALSFFAASTTYATPVRFDFTGVITHTMASPGMPNILSSSIPDGANFSGYFVFESNSPGSIYDPNETGYDNSIMQYRVEIGSYFAEFNNGAIAVTNNKPEYDPLGNLLGYSDMYTAQARMNITSQPTTLVTNFNIPDYSLTAAALWTYDYSAQMVSDTNLPIYAPDISGTHTEFLLDFNYGGGNSRDSAYGYLTSLTPVAPSTVPIPSSIWLLCSTLIPLARHLAKKRK